MELSSVIGCILVRVACSCRFYLNSDVGPDLPAEVVEAAFQYAQQHNLPLAAFLGDECATLQMHPELEAGPFRLHITVLFGLFTCHGFSFC